MLSTHEPMIDIARVNVISRDQPGRTDVLRHGALAGAGACARTRNVERGYSTVRCAHEPVTYITRVHVVSLNCSCLVDAKCEGALASARARAGSIERGHSSVWSAHDNVKHIAIVKGSCRDRPCGVETINSKNNRALTGAGACIRSIKRSDDAVRSAQEPVTYTLRVNVASRDRPRRIDVAGASTLAGTCARTQNVEGSNDTVRTAQETVEHIVRVNVASRDRAFRVDAERECALAGACPRAWSVECGDVTISSAQETMT